MSFGFVLLNLRTADITESLSLGDESVTKIFLGRLDELSIFATLRQAWIQLSEMGQPTTSLSFLNNDETFSFRFSGTAWISIL